MEFDRIKRIKVDSKMVLKTEFDIVVVIYMKFEVINMIEKQRVIEWSRSLSSRST